MRRGRSAATARTESVGSHPGAHLYDALGVSEGATPEEITAAYRRTAQMYHPDKVAGLGPEFGEIADRRMKEINAAVSPIETLGMKVQRPSA